MKLRMLLFTGCILLMSGLANAQFNCSWDHDCTSGQTPLSTLCGFAGDPLPDGTNVEIFWDQNNNGPDALDEQPVVGPGFGQCNFNSFAMNGDADLGCTGGFYMTETFTISTNTPSPSRYWLRICIPGVDRYWYTSPFTVVDGYQEIHIQDSSWYCVEEACGGCINPETVSNFTASENSCSEVTLNWSAYPADQEVDSLFIYYRNTFDTLVSVVGRTATTYSYVTAPQGTRQYLIVPRRIHAPDTCFGIAAFDNGTRNQAAASPTTCAATSNLCGSVIVSWTNPGDLTTVDSFAVLRNGIEVTRQRIGLPGQANADTVFIAGAATYTVAGWNAECGLGTPSAGAAGNGAAAPATPTGVTATVGLCAININWNVSAGANSYKIFRDGNLIQTLPAPPLNGYEPPAASTNYTFTVIASNTANPASCQDSPPSLGATGSDIDQPNAPTTVAATDSAFCTHVVVTWVDNSSNETGFIVRRDGVAIDTVAAGVVTFNDSGAVPGTNHAYTVASVNDCGPSGFISGGTGSKKQAPPTVTGTSATDNLADRVTVTWNNTIRETGYRILRNGTTLNTVAADVVTYDDMTAAAGQVYAYSVLAFGDCGDGDTSVVDSGRVLASLNPPTNVAASDTHCTIVTVTWTDNNTAPAETGHEILRDNVVIGNVGANVTTFDDNTAVRGNVYSYNVRATGPGGPATSATPDDGQLAPLPGIPTLTIDSVTCTDVHLAWTNGTNGDTMVIFQDGVEWAVILGTSGSTVGTLSDDDTHFYNAVGANECGRGDSSATVSAQRDQVPGAVDDLAGTSTDCNSVHLTWTSPPDADNLEIFMDGVSQGSFAAFLSETTIITGPGPFSRQFYIIASNECGVGDTSNVIDVAVQQPPTMPTDVAASDTSCSFVYVTWTGSAGEVDGYDIYRDASIAGSVDAGTLTFSDQPGDALDHSYTVVATSATCAESGPSTAAIGSQLEPVGTPTGLAQTQPEACDSIRVCWNAATGDVDGYNVYEDGLLVGTTADLCFAYVPAGGAGSYSLTVSSYSVLCGESSESPSIDAVLYETPGVENFAATLDRCDGVNLTWDASGFSNLDGYDIYRNDVLIFSGNSHNVDRTYFDSGALIGSNHYAIIATSSAPACGNSDSATADGALVPEPLSPTTVAATDTSCLDVLVTWSVGSGTFDYYLVRRGGVDLAVVFPPTQEYADNTITAGTTAEYTVLAVDSVCGAAGIGGTDDGTRLLGPDAPVLVSATTGSCDTIFVAWMTSAGDVTEYRVFRDDVLVGTVPAPDLTFADVPPTSGIFSYTVRAFSTFCGETNNSNAIDGERLPDMGQVSGVIASVDSCDAIYVTWDEFTGADQYIVFRDGVSIDTVDAPLAVDPNVAEGVAHSYTISAVNPCNEGEQSLPAVGSRAQTPAQVTGLTATTTLINEVCLSWDDLDGELAYNVYRDDVLIFATSADDTSYCDNTATPGVNFSYTVAATNVCGEGDASVAAIGTAVFNLGEVTGLAATTTDCDEICLQWTDIEFEDGYEILRGGVVIDSVDANITVYCDATPLPGECFDYTVRGYNVGGSGPNPTAVEGCRRNIPTQVVDLTATTTNCTVVNLNWTDATDEDAYDVYRDGGLLVQNLPANTTSYVDNTATPGVPYQYTVVARNACGSAAASAAAQGAVATVPPVVDGVFATVDVCNQIGLNWTDQLSELGYRIYRDGNFGTPIATVGANVVSYVDNNITGAHTYNVRAFNDCGNGELSETVNGLGLTVPGIATDVAAVENCGDVTVTWTAPTAGPIVEYDVWRNNVEIATVAAGTTTYLDESVAAGTYSYKIITTNQCGAGAQSAPSNSVTVIPALVQVTGLAATATSCFCVNVSWSNVANETGYYLYCDGVIVDTLNANVTSTTYCPADTQNCLVQVAAFNGCEIGPLSNGVSVTPNTYPVAVTGFTASENICDRVRLQWDPYSAPGVTLLKIRRNGANLANVTAGSTSYEQLGVWPASSYSIAALRVCSPGDTIESVLTSDDGRTAPTPVAPTQMDATDNGCGIVTVTFTFANVEGQDSVHVKRNGVIIARLAGGLPNVQRNFVDLNPLTLAATYQVCALSNICGLGGCADDLGQAAPTAGTVTNLEATNDRCTSIILTWTGTQHATGYIVRRNNAIVDTVDQGLFTFTDIVATGTSNNYTVTAINACGAGPTTPQVAGSTIPLPPAPTGVAASDGVCNQVIVSWNEIAVATEYQIWRNNVQIGTSPDGVVSFVDTDVQPGVTYNYQVRGVNQCGLGTLSAVTTGFSAANIAQVTNLVASVDLDDRVHLSWNNVTQEIGYEILRGFPPVVIDTVGIDVTNYDDFSAAPGEEYEYRVRAFNGCGTGAASDVAYGYRLPVDPIIFGVITVTEDLFGCLSAVPADMDNDGDMDVVAAGMFADKVVWYENNGTWIYIPHVVVEDWDGARSVAVGDIDDDGDLDIAAVAQFADQLVWFRHNANGTFTQFVIASNYDGARDVLIADIDGDNDEDLVTAAGDANDVSWWRNNGSEAFTRLVIDNNFVGARSIELADIGSDGDLDVLGAAFEGGMFAWYSNNGSEVFTRNVLANGWFGASYMNAAHLNHDQVLDFYFCVAQEPLIGWWDGTTQEFNYVSSLVPFPREMDAIDMDNDTLPELLLAANENQEISWWRNTDNRFYRNVVTTTLNQASVVHGGDFENDGDIDILGAGEGTIKIWLSAQADDAAGTELMMPHPEDDGGDRPALGQTVIPLNPELSSNWPNPFNPTTRIRFGLPEAESVLLTVFDITGREVARLADGYFTAGYHTVSFDATNLASGLYFYRVEAGNFVASRKMVLMK